MIGPKKNEIAHFLQISQFMICCRQLNLKNSIKNNSASIKWETRKSKPQPKLSGSLDKKFDRSYILIPLE